MVKTLLYIAITVRILTQMLGSDSAYFVGVNFFDMAALIALAFMTDNKERSLLLFFAGCAGYNIFKEYFGNPLVDEPFDYFFFLSGLFLVLANYVYKRLNN